MKVVPGDVLDDAAAAFAKLAGAVDEFRSDEEVTRGAIGLAQGRVDPRCDGAADGAERIPGNQERKELVVFEQMGIHFCDGRAGIDAKGEITGIVMRDLIERSHVEGDVVARRRHADAEFGAGTVRDEGEFFARGEADNFGGFFGRGWFCDDGRDHIVHGIDGALGAIGENTRSADEGFHGGGEIGR